MKTRDHERRDSGIIIILILLLGFICIILASGWAIRFAPSWRLDNTNMRSNLNPNSVFLTGQPVNLIEPLDPAILTNPVWLNGYLTPGAVFATRTPLPTSTATNIPSVPPKTGTPVPTLTAVATNTWVVVVIPPTNTQIYFPPPSATVTPNPPPTNTPVTPPASADLQITKTDNATDYDANISVQYTIVASNLAGPSGVAGATVADAFSANLTNITWTCAGSGGASCTAVGSGNINDTAVNLPVGGSVTYTVNATVIASPGGPLVNTATVSSSVFDPTPGNNSATDTDQLVVSNGSVDPTPGGSVTNIPGGTFLVLQFGTPLVVGPGSYIVYYPPPPAPALEMDAVILQIGDGSNWYTILNWGNGFPDTNTDISVPLASPTDCTGEPDNCPIDVSLLTNSPGVTINLGAVPAGTYPYIRILSPSAPTDSGDGVDVDAIVVFP